MKILFLKASMKRFEAHFDSIYIMQFCAYLSPEARIGRERASVSLEPFISETFIFAECWRECAIYVPFPYLHRFSFRGYISLCCSSSLSVQTCRSISKLISLSMIRFRQLLGEVSHLEMLMRVRKILKYPHRKNAGFPSSFCWFSRRAKW